jgi:hypothetical protein
MPIFWSDLCPCGKQIALDNKGNGIIWAVRKDEEMKACCSAECAHRYAARRSGFAAPHTCPCCKAKYYEAD